MFIFYGGSVSGSPDEASGRASGLVETLNTDEKFDPLFANVALTSLARNPVTGALSLEIESKVINPGALATNLQFFYRLEQALGLTIVDLQQEVVEKPKQPLEYLPVPYSISVQGTYTQRVDFMQNLEQGDRVVRYLSSNFSPARGLAAQ